MSPTLTPYNGPLSNAVLIDDVPARRLSRSPPSIPPNTPVTSGCAEAGAAVASTAPRTAPSSVIRPITVKRFRISPPAAIVTELRRAGLCVSGVGVLRPHLHAAPPGHQQQCGTRHQ